MSIALIGPEDRRREAMALALREYPSVLVREFASYPASRDELPTLVDQYDALIIDLDSNLEFALELVENLERQGLGYGDGVFRRGESGQAGAEHAGRRAGVSCRSGGT